MQQAMSQVGSTPLLALLMAYQPEEVPLEQQAAAAAAAGQDAQQQQQHAKPVLELPFDAAAVVNSQEIQWLCMDSRKPVRGGRGALQLLCGVMYNLNTCPACGATLQPLCQCVRGSERVRCGWLPAGCQHRLHYSSQAPTWSS